MDLFVANYGDPNALYRSNGASGGFTKMGASDVGDVATDIDSSYGATFADFDGGSGPLPAARACGLRRAFCIGWAFGAGLGLRRCGAHGGVRACVPAAAGLPVHGWPLPGWRASVAT